MSLDDPLRLLHFVLQLAVILIIVFVHRLHCFHRLLLPLLFIKGMTRSRGAKTDYKVHRIG